VNKRWVEVPIKHEGDVTAIMVDIDFLLSGYGCIWGNGCKGIHNDGDGLTGCCSLGVEVQSNEVSKLKDLVSQLTSENWENHGKKWLRWKRYGKKFHRNTTLRPDKKGCVFSNSKDFSGGAGCALHIAALERGESYIGTKPEVCWAIPLRLTFTDDPDAFWLTGHNRNDWGGEVDFPKWWCVSDDSPEPWAHDSPFYHRYHEELLGVFSINNLEGVYEEQVKPILDHLWERAPKMTGRHKKPKAVPVQLSFRG
jgi:hypothetical protein